MSFGPRPLPSILPSSLVDRFWSKVGIGNANECWPWLGFCDRKGYGYFRIGRFVYRAHRVAFHLEIDESNPPEVLHSCDYPSCCNFLHLSGGTHADNMEDMASKGRGNTSQRGDANTLRINPPIGDLHPLARLTWDTVREIRARVLSGEQMCAGVAAEYGIGYRHLHDIAIGKRWKDATYVIRSK